MSRLLHAVLTTAKLDDFHLVVTALCHHFRSHLATIDIGGTNFQVFAGLNQQHLIKGHCFAGRDFQLFQLEGFTLYHTVLFTTALDHCVHKHILQKPACAV